MKGPTFKIAARELAEALQGLIQCDQLMKTKGIRSDVDHKARRKAASALLTYKKAKA